MKQQYLVSQRGLKSQPELLVSLKYDRLNEPVEAQLSELPAVVKNNPVLRNAMPRRVTVNGKKAGVFPCIMCKTDVSAAYLSGAVGYKVSADDGVSFATQAAARKVALSLKELGADLDQLELEWRIGSVVEAGDQQIPLLLQRPTPTEGDKAPWE